MKVIKRDGHMVDYCPEKIEQAILKANKEVEESEQASNTQIKNIIKYIESLGKKRILVEDIQDIIEMKLMSIGKYQLAKKYITYRYTRELVRRSNTTDLAIKELIDGENEYWNTENSNKNAKIVTTQRDYLAGITSTDITRRFLLPEEIVEAHDQGIIHFHDADYFAQNALHNCDLINLEDMLQNGTNINGVMIEKPHKFLTAVTIATQIITAVSSSQYGGCTITLTHLAPFVRDSYNRYLKIYKNRKLSKEDCEKFAKEDLKTEITAGVQTFQYQVNSMTTTNGQAPFLSVCMYLGETEEYKEELAMIIEEFLNQRIEGMKNEKGVYITPAFPKLLYVLEEDNILLLNLCNSLPIQLLLLRILKRQRMQIQPMRYFRFYRGCRKKIPVGTLRQLTALIHILTFRRIQVPELRRRFQGSPHCYSYLYTMRHLPILKPWPHRLQTRKSPLPCTILNPTNKDLRKIPHRQLQYQTLSLPSYLNLLLYLWSHRCTPPTRASFPHLYPLL